MAIALMAPVGVMAAGPVGAGTAVGTSCAAPSGKITITPGLTSVKKVQTIAINLPVKACKGGGVSVGAAKGSIKTTAINTATFASGKPVKLLATIVWNTKKTSTFTANTVATVSKTGVITAVVKGKVTKGNLFVGRTVTTTVKVKLGPLVKGAVKNLTITGIKPFVIK